MKKSFFKIALALIFIFSSVVSFGSIDKKPSKFKSNTFNADKNNSNQPKGAHYKGEDEDENENNDGSIPNSLTLVMLGSIAIWGYKTRKSIKLENEK